MRFTCTDSPSHFFYAKNKIEKEVEKIWIRYAQCFSAAIQAFPLDRYRLHARFQENQYVSTCFGYAPRLMKASGGHCCELEDLPRASELIQIFQNLARIFRTIYILMSISPKHSFKCFKTQIASYYSYRHMLMRVRIPQRRW